MVLNIAHSEFPEQQGGLMICGYEWGGGEEEGEGVSEPQIDWSANCTFANKDLRYGPAALGWRYDNRIKKWFDMWGCPLNHDDPGEFEKSIIQTNWGQDIERAQIGKAWKSYRRSRSRTTMNGGSAFEPKDAESRRCCGVTTVRL